MYSLVHILQFTVYLCVLNKEHFSYIRGPLATIPGVGDSKNEWYRGSVCPLGHLVHWSGGGRGPRVLRTPPKMAVGWTPI